MERVQPLLAWKIRMLVKAFCLALEGNHPPRASSSLLWLRLVPSWVQGFYWLALEITAKISTTDILRKRGLTSNNIVGICVICGKALVNHISLHCEVAVLVWSNFIETGGLAWCGPRISWMWWSCGYVGVSYSVWIGKRKIFRGSSSSIAKLISSSP